MKDIWNQFENWLSTNWPDGLAALNPPATDHEIASLESALGVKLPQDFIECLKVHNGQSEMFGGVFDGQEFLSSTAILSQWGIWKGLLDSGEFSGVASEPQEGVRSDWWNAGWIPFTHNGGGDHYCIDLAPNEGGQVGQVITMWHDAGERTLEAQSFRTWFAQFVAAVIAGDYVYSDDYGGLVHKDDA